MNNMITVHFFKDEKIIDRTYVFYTKKEILRLAKKYGIENDYDEIYIPVYQIFLTRHGKRWFQ